MTVRDDRAREHAVKTSTMTRRTRNRMSRWALAVVAPLLVVTAATAASPWSVVPSPNPSATGNELTAVAAVSPQEVWAVGDSTASVGGLQTLIEQWNGTAWSVVPSPNPGAHQNSLSGVSAVAAQDVWAVGRFNNALDIPQTLIEHWDGSTWDEIASPNIGVSTNVLNAVSAASPSDVWAVGQFSAASGFLHTLIEHWNGQQWSVVPSPNVGTHNNVLHGVTAISATDAWAVGSVTDSNGTQHALIEHWNGLRWRVVGLDAAASVLNGVTAISAFNIWAVGQVGTQTLTEHWNGLFWRIVPSPNGGTLNDGLNSVSAVSGHDVWAVGFDITSGPSLTLIEHWNGLQWSVVPSPNPSTSLNFLNGVAADRSSSQAWAVGVFFTDSGTSQTLTAVHPPL